MRIGVFAYHHESVIGYDAFQIGAERLADLHQIVRRNPAPFTPDQVEDYDLICTWGSTRAKFQSIISTYASKGIPAIVLEMSYFGRDTSISIGINKQYWLPEEDMPSDRWDKLAIEIEPYRSVGDGYILVCSQDNCADWENTVVRKLSAITDREIIVRRHPTWTAPELRVPLEDHLKGAYCIVVDTSNLGNEALVKGIPVFCSENAMFAEIAFTDLSQIETFDVSTLPNREQYFYRLAYGQWTIFEIANDQVLQWYFDRMFKDEVPSISTKSNNVSIVTCTGNRLEALKVCINYMARQTRKPDQWIIVDDGDNDQMVTMDMFIGCGIPDIQIIRRERNESDPPHTMPVNLSAALDNVTGMKIIIIEDDDWYSPRYIAQTAERLEYADLVGIQGIYYWNIAHRCFCVTGTNRPHSSFCQTAFTSKVINTVKHICIHGDSHDSRVFELGLVDIALWRQWSGSRELYPLTMDVIGIKGLPGRVGLTTGHKNYNRFKHDRCLKELEYFIKNDVENYLPYKLVEVEA